MVGPRFLVAYCMQVHLHKHHWQRPFQNRFGFVKSEVVVVVDIYLVLRRSSDVVEVVVERSRQRRLDWFRTCSRVS